MLRLGRWLTASDRALPCAASFRVVALRRGATLVTAATLRVFGAKFAELPFVATKEGAWALTVLSCGDFSCARSCHKL